jgi:PAS domain S-box-containing protein
MGSDGMKIVAIISLVAAGIALFMGSFVLSKNPKKLINRLFLLISLGTTYWGIIEFGLFQAESLETAIWWQNAGALWAFPIAFLMHFTVVYTKQKDPFKKIMRLQTYIGAVLISILEMTTNLITDTPIKRDWGWAYSTSGMSAVVFIMLIWVFTTSFLAVYLCWRYFLIQTDDTRKQQAKYVLLGVPLPSIVGIITEVVVPALNLGWPPLTTLADSIGTLIIGYAIIRYYLFGITPEMATESILTNVSDFLLLVDSKGTIQRVNQAALNALGYEEGELVNHSITKVLSNETFIKEELIDRISIVQDIEIDIKTKEGKITPTSLSTSLIHDSSGIKGIIYLMRDISDRKRMQIERRSLEEKRASFIQITSHELRTPLTAIQGYTELIQNLTDAESKENLGKYLQIISRNVNRLKRLIEGVSTLGQIERGVFQLDRQEIDFNTLFIEVMQTYQIFLGPQLQIQTNLGGTPLIIEGDTIRLHQVLDNLMENAVKHTSPQERAIIVTLEALSQNLQVQVTDNGAGIDPINLERIFEPFTAFSTQYASGGTGIGLFLARTLAEAHGGSLIAASKGREEGATFILELPIIRK